MSSLPFTPEHFEYAPRLERAIYRLDGSVLPYAYIYTPSAGVRATVVSSENGTFTLSTCRTPHGKIVVPVEEHLEQNGSEYYRIVHQEGCGLADALDSFMGLARKGDSVISHEFNIPHETQQDIRERLRRYFSESANNGREYNQSDETSDPKLDQTPWISAKRSHI